MGPRRATSHSLAERHSIWAIAEISSQAGIADNQSFQAEQVQEVDCR
jgi:hypothetical protein